MNCGASLFIRSHSMTYAGVPTHTQTHTHTVGRTPLGERSAGRRDLYITTKNIHKRDVHVPGDIQTHNPRPQTNASDRMATAIR